GVRVYLVKQVVGVLADLAHRTAGGSEQAGDRVVDRFVPPFDQAIGEQQQRVAEPQAGHLFGVAGPRIRAEQQSFGQRKLLRLAVAYQDRRQVTGPGPAQRPVDRIVETADRGAEYAVGEVRGRAVQPVEQGRRAGPGDRQPA